MKFKFRKQMLAGLTGALMIVLSAVASAADFTQADLEGIVHELDAFLPHNADYQYPVKCSIVQKDDINAYATIEDIDGQAKPQAEMVVFTGYVNFVKGDKDMIRAVVAHELAHLSKGHPTKGGFKVNDVQTLYVRQIEMEADAVGCAALVAAGHPKSDMVKMLLMLDEIGKDTPLMHQLGADHPSGAVRAAAVADNPLVYRSLADFQLGNAFMESRQFAQAESAYERAIGKEPKFGEAYVNLAQARLMDYYDKLPQSTKETWFLPDFGPVIRDTGVGSRKVEISAEDRARYAKAVEAINNAVDKAPGMTKATELKALSQVLEPDANADSINAGIAAFQTLLSGSVTDVDRLRYANNMAIGLQRKSDVKSGVEAMMAAQQKSSRYNRYLAENLGLHGMTMVKKDDLGLALGVVYAWLQNTPTSHDKYDELKKEYLDTCAANNFKARDIKPSPTYLCIATTLNVRGKEISFGDPIMDVVNLFGKATKAWSFSNDYPDMLELRWDDQQLNILGDKSGVFRVTSYDPGSFVLLKPENDTVRQEFKISVGMSEDDLNKILGVDNGEEVQLVRSGTVETWVYFSGINMGVCLKDGKVLGVTVTP